LPVPVPVHALDDVQPAHIAHFPPAGHWESLVHQQGTPAAVHLPLGNVTVLQLPMGHDHAWATEVDVRQSSPSAGPLPEHMLPMHWPSLLTHLPLGQFESVTQRHAEWSDLRIGAGVSVVMHAVPPTATHGTELGAGSQPLPSSVPVPVQSVQLLLFELGMQWPLAQARSDVQ
jgi:hypothetical protein